MPDLDLTADQREIFIRNNFFTNIPDSQRAAIKLGGAKKWQEVVKILKDAFPNEQESEEKRESVDVNYVQTFRANAEPSRASFWLIFG
jgi:hypothetical protein